MQFLPLIVLGFIIFFSVASSKARRQQEEARKAAIAQAQQQRNEQLQQQQQAPKPQQTPPPKPAVPKASPPKNNRPVKNYPAQKKAETAPTVADRIVKETRQPAEEKHVTGQKTSAPVLSPLKWDRNAAMQGIVYAEILGKPKALRHR